MQPIWLTAQIILAVIITGCILLQSQETGMGGTWRGGGETYHTRRGVERVVFIVTIVAVALFALVSIATIA
jgi:preprotein translocase subunit SecG